MSNISIQRQEESFNNFHKVKFYQEKIGNLVDTFSGGTPTSTNTEYYNGNINFIGSGDIDKTNVTKMITNDAFKNCSAKLIEKGDILYALYGATSGKVSVSKLDGAINQAVLCIRPNGILEKFFLYYFLEYKKNYILKTYLQGGQGNLSADIIKNLTITYYEMNIQNKIANFLTSLDSLIQKQEEYIEELKIQKKAYSQKIFSQELRFEGFDNSWELQKIKSFLIKYTEKNTNCNISNISSVGKYGVSNRTLEIKVEHIINNKILFSNCAVIGMGSKQIDFGINKLGYDTLVSPAYHTFKIPCESFDTIFIDEIIKQNNLKLSSLYMITGARQGKSVAIDDLLEHQLCIPSIKEQEKISGFLSVLYDKIELQEQKLEQLKLKKKYYLNKIFL